MQQATIKRSTSSSSFGYDACLILSVLPLQSFQISPTTTWLPVPMASSTAIIPPAALRSTPPLHLILLMKTIFSPTLLTKPLPPHYLPTDHHIMARSPPGPGPKTLALDHRRTPPPPPPPSGGLTSLQNCTTITPALALLPRKPRNCVPGQKMYCEIAALSGGLCLH